MGRRAKNPDRAGVTVELPRDLLLAIKEHADAIYRGDRAHAIKTLLWRGLGARRTQFERFDAVIRAGLRGEDSYDVGYGQF